MDINIEKIKDIKVYDTFLFNNEFDLLEIRFNILNEYVDYFVLVESSITFSSNNKPLYYENNKDRFSKWSDKIIHVIVDNNVDELWQLAKSSPNVGAGESWWLTDFYQKENVIVGLTNANENDLVFVSDLDDIWEPCVIFKDGYSYDLDNVYRPIQTAYHYYLNNKSNQDISAWTGTRFSSVKTLKKYGANHFRTEREVQSVNIENGGWHFTNIGDFNFIKEKLESYSHQEYNSDFIKNRIEKSIESNVDFLNRGFSLWKDELNLPEYLIKNKKKYKHLFYD